MSPLTDGHIQDEHLYKLFSIESEKSLPGTIFKIELVKNGRPYLKRISSEEIGENTEIIEHLSKKDRTQIDFYLKQEARTD